MRVLIGWIWSGAWARAFLTRSQVVLPIHGAPHVIAHLLILTQVFLV